LRGRRLLCYVVLSVTARTALLSFSVTVNAIRKCMRLLWKKGRRAFCAAGAATRVLSPNRGVERFGLHRALRQKKPRGPPSPRGPSEPFFVFRRGPAARLREGERRAPPPCARYANSWSPSSGIPIDVSASLFCSRGMYCCKKGGKRGGRESFGEGEERAIRKREKVQQSH
jgi:hypothetical protein